MRKRSMIAAVASALALVVLTAGLAFAGGRWDDRQGPGQAVDDRVTSGWTQPQAQQVSGRWSPPGSARARTAPAFTRRPDAPTGTTSTAQTRQSTAPTARADGLHNARPGPATDAGPSTSGQPWQDSRNHRENRHDRHEFRDGHCQDDRR